MIRRLCSALLALGLAFATATESAGADPITVVGTGDGLEMLREVADGYGAEKGTAVGVPPSIGSGGAIAAVTSGRERIGRVARPLSEAERAQGLDYHPLARIPSAFYVNPTVEIGNLTAAETVAIYAGTITNWRDVGGPDLKIRVVRREEADSTLQTLRATMPGWKDLALTPLSKTALTTQDAIETVERVPGAIGFGPFSRGLERSLRVLTVDGRHPLDERYWSGVTLAFITKGTIDADIADFLAFASTAEAKRIIRDFGASPL